MEAIVAVFSDWGIGADGTQQVVLKADRAHFRELTAGAAVIVGRRTLGDFPGGKPLKGRHNIVVTRQELTIEGAQVAHSTEEALAAAARWERCLVIGDTPNDISCARAVGAKALAVATGKFSIEELREHQPDFLLPDLTDIPGFLKMIGA